MEQKLIRVGTTYLPVRNVDRAAQWYEEKLSATCNYKDQDKAIIDLANHSVFLMKAKESERSYFYTAKGEKQFSVTFEVDGLKQLHGSINRYPKAV
ncbi:VOC family protein [Bacillus sp. JCM 19041]|uniref:VOC family protein n=1 Tax=Bacillus sp. JCM 19041 TaxID=1460637 RepID=UPI000A80E55A